MIVPIEDDDLASRLRTARVAVGWSQREVADHLGTSQPSVQRWEAGQPPSPRMRQRIAQLLHTIEEVYTADDATDVQSGTVHLLRPVRREVSSHDPLMRERIALARTITDRLAEKSLTPAEIEMFKLAASLLTPD